MNPNCVPFSHKLYLFVLNYDHLIYKVIFEYTAAYNDFTYIHLI